MEHEKETQKHLSELSEQVACGDIAMLTTKTVGGHLRSRPMEVCHISDNGDIYFFTQTSGDLTADITDNNHVSLSFINKADDNYTSVSGLAQLNNNYDDMVAFWDPRYERWIHGQLEDPSVVLLKINPFYADHWAFSGLVGKLFKFIKSGETEPELVHEKLGGE